MVAVAGEEGETGSALLQLLLLAPTNGDASKNCDDSQSDGSDGSVSLVSLDDEDDELDTAESTMMGGGRAARSSDGTSIVD